MKDLMDDGLVRAIGICDVDGALLEELLRQRRRPHIIQNWMDPFHQDREVRRRCREEGIQYQAYSSLGSQWVHFRGYGSNNPVLEHPVLREIAALRQRTVPQVVLNWAVVHHGAAVIPASTSAERQRSNLDSFGFELSLAEVARIDSLDGILDAAVDAVFDNMGRPQHHVLHSEL
ncbi:xyl1 [Symbiodinium natans]|uniref:Xyl1 protein n=1 Tax=Symbiodinium natans TaxID=878477 RepID=A0A812QD68_9DINO|nr:xyl1 [Symbiodinium natans]